MTKHASNAQLRNEATAKLLRENDIPFTIPAAGSFKIVSLNCVTLMFYPKSLKLIWVSLWDPTKTQKVLVGPTTVIIDKIKEVW